MSRQIQFRRGTADQHKTFTGAPGEITVDLTNKTLRVHDGETPGGTMLARQADIGAVTPQLDFDARTDYTSASQITIPSNGILFCRGNTRAMDWVESDFNTVIMAEYVLSCNYTTVWAPVFAGQCLKNRATSEYQMLVFIPYKTATI